MSNGPHKASLAKNVEIALAHRGNASKLINNLGKLNIQAMVLGTAADTTTDFADVKIGDLIVDISNGGFEVATAAGEKPTAGAIGDLYMLLRGMEV
jgi:hypothetical protein